jgi:hypothetical protein
VKAEGCTQGARARGRMREDGYTESNRARVRVKAKEIAQGNSHERDCEHMHSGL